MNESIEFNCTQLNLDRISAFMRYCEMLSMIAKQDPDCTDDLDFNGFMNSLLDEILSKKVKEIIKRHSFFDEAEFIDGMKNCANPGETRAFIDSVEHRYYMKEYNRILSFMPIEDNQKTLPFEVVK